MPDSGTEPAVFVFLIADSVHWSEEGLTPQPAVFFLVTHRGTLASWQVAEGFSRYCGSQLGLTKGWSQARDQPKCEQYIHVVCHLRNRLYYRTFLLGKFTIHRSRPSVEWTRWAKLSEFARFKTETLLSNLLYSTLSDFYFKFTIFGNLSSDRLFNRSSRVWSWLPWVFSKTFDCLFIVSILEKFTGTWWDAIRNSAPSLSNKIVEKVQNLRFQKSSPLQNNFRRPEGILQNAWTFFLEMSASLENSLGRSRPNFGLFLIMQDLW